MVFDSCGTIHWKFLQSIWNIFLRPAATWVSGTFFFGGVMLGHGRGSITFISGIYMVDTWILSLEKGSPTGDFCGNLSADRWEVRDIFGYVIQVLACDKKRCCSWNAIYGSSRRARGRADNDIACRWAGDGGKWKRDIGLPWIWMICCQCFVFKNFLPRFLDSSKGLEKTRGHIQISFASTSENSLPRWCNGTWQPQIALVETLFCLGKLAEAWIAPGINETI